jgi:hypothetical protein
MKTTKKNESKKGYPRVNTKGGSKWNRFMWGFPLMEEDSRS